MCSDDGRPPAGLRGAQREEAGAALVDVARSPRSRGCATARARAAWIASPARAPRGARRSGPAPRPAPRPAPCCGWCDRRHRPNATPRLGPSRCRVERGARRSRRRARAVGHAQLALAQLALAARRSCRRTGAASRAHARRRVARLAVDRLRRVRRGRDPDRPVERARQVDGEVLGDRRRRADAAYLRELHRRQLAGLRRAPRAPPPSGRSRSRRPRAESASPPRLRPCRAGRRSAARQARSSTAPACAGSRSRPRGSSWRWRRPGSGRPRRAPPARPRPAAGRPRRRA